MDTIISPVAVLLLFSVAPQCRTWDPRGGVRSRSKGWRWGRIRVGFRD